VLVYFLVIPESPSKEALLLPIYTAKLSEYGRVLSGAGTSTAMTVDGEFQSRPAGYVTNPEYCITVV